MPALLGMGIGAGGADRCRRLYGADVIRMRKRESKES
jgi:hypothetical protein